MRVVSCDRCTRDLTLGNKKRDDYTLVMEIGDVFDDEHVKKDLCRDCVKDLMEWITTGMLKVVNT